ncbi:MAG: PrsW family intramembrane metalloprotease [Victivallales bacterium]|nr:PrsW family intramembrane metalloprotease [Victivallales bacterium]
MTILIKCDNCGKDLEADEQYIGQNAECPNCHHQITITAPVEINQEEQMESIASEKAESIASEKVESIASEQVESIISEATEQTIIKYCPKCGEAIKQQAHFCMKCGYEITNKIQASPSIPSAPIMTDDSSQKGNTNISSSTITIERADQILGPFDYGQFKDMFINNKLYLNDITRINNTGNVLTLRKAVKQLGWEIPTSERENDVLHKIGIDFLFPWRNFRKADEYKNSNFIYMCIVGLIPLILILIGTEMELPIKFIYIGYAAYFTLLWSMFFWSILNTENVQVKQCLKCFFITFFISMTLLLFCHSIGLFSFANNAIKSNLAIIRIIGFFFIAGLPEEICKALSVYWLLSKRGIFFHAEAIVFYGIFSGLAFGIKEGLGYQQGFNKSLGDSDYIYFLNLLRLTSLPFLHALWCGIASYFLAFAAQYPMYRHCFTIIAILLPAILHAIYDGGGSFLGIITSVITVFLFLFYYKNIKTLDDKLNHLS